MYVRTMQLGPRSQRGNPRRVPRDVRSAATWRMRRTRARRSCSSGCNADSREETPTATKSGHAIVGGSGAVGDAGGVDGGTSIGRIGACGSLGALGVTGGPSGKRTGGFSDGRSMGFSEGRSGVAGVSGPLLVWVAHTSFRDTEEFGLYIRRAPKGDSGCPTRRKTRATMDPSSVGVGVVSRQGLMEASAGADHSNGSYECNSRARRRTFLRITRGVGARDEERGDSRSSVVIPFTIGAQDHSRCVGRSSFGFGPGRASAGWSGVPNHQSSEHQNEASHDER